MICVQNRGDQIRPFNCFPAGIPDPIHPPGQSPDVLWPKTSLAHPLERETQGQLSHQVASRQTKSLSDLGVQNPDRFGRSKNRRINETLLFDLPGLPIYPALSESLTFCG